MNTNDIDQINSKIYEIQGKYQPVKVIQNTHQVGELKKKEDRLLNEIQEAVRKLEAVKEA